MFLRSPLRYSRVTSHFSHRRFHPVLKSYRPHYGVDYGAPVGTPVQVTASGIVVSSGWDRGGGNVVKVRHAGGYVTAYLHLSKLRQGHPSRARASGRATSSPTPARPDWRAARTWTTACSTAASGSIR